MNLYEIMNIATSDLLIKSIRDMFCQEELSRNDLVTAEILAKKRAAEIGCADQINALFDDYREDIEKRQCEEEIKESLAKTMRGTAVCSSENFLKIYNGLPYYNRLRFNEFSNTIEITEPGSKKTRRWTDSDEATFRSYAESTFGIYSKAKSDDALLSLLQFKERRYNPVKEIVESIKWDGTTRIERCLTEIMKCEDVPYVREVSRLIFAGGINRLYYPGCKFDDMPVLIGKQGCGKSSFVEWLSLDTKYNLVLNSIEGKDALQNLQGKWIVEMAELAALTKKKEQEAIKTFISTQVDTFRQSYGKHSTDYPRTCIFIGTTNAKTFIADQTGGRRFYPVEVQSNGFDLHNHKSEHLEYIRQCWAEAREKLNTDFMQPFIRREVLKCAQENQEAATFDDYRIGKIQSWLDNSKNVSKVCFSMIWEEILGEDFRTPTRADETSIGTIMSTKIDGWERCNWRIHFPRYGKQRFWRRINHASDGEKMPFDD